MPNNFNPETPTTDETNQEKLVTPTPEVRKVTPKRPHPLAQKVGHGAEALDLGQELDKFFEALETLRNFENTTEYQEFRPYQRQPESGPKSEKRAKAQEKLNQLLKELQDTDKKTKTIAKFWQHQLTV